MEREGVGGMEGKREKKGVTLETLYNQTFISPALRGF